jgi:SPW repeat
MVMLRQGPISLTLHSMLEPVIAALLIAAPFLFGFSDDGAPTAVSIVIGLGVLVVGMSTRWRLSLVKAIPIPVHLTIDLIVGALLIAAPFLFGFSDDATATAFFLIAGVGEILATLATRWTPTNASTKSRKGRGRAVLG